MIIDYALQSTAELLDYKRRKCTMCGRLSKLERRRITLTGPHYQQVIAVYVHSETIGSRGNIEDCDICVGEIMTQN
jgi:hypothetical protein